MTEILEKTTPDISGNCDLEPCPITDMNIKHLVISGGGVTGFSFYGILRESHKCGHWKLENIQTIYGTSIGAILAAILCLGYDWDILDTYFIKRPWQKLFNFDIYSMLNIFEHKGVFNIKVVEEILSPLLSGVGIPLDITLQQFFERTHIEIHVFSTELNRMHMVDISYKTHPDWPLVQAIYCSCIVPLVFEPYIITTQTGEGDEPKDTEKQCYIDGGFLTNYPLNRCILDTGAEPDEILGINKQHTSCDVLIDKKSSLFDYINMAFNRMFDIILEVYQGAKVYDIPHEYTVSDTAINLESIINTSSSMEERVRLIQIGADLVHCRTKSPPVLTDNNVE